MNDGAHTYIEFDNLENRPDSSSDPDTEKSNGTAEIQSCLGSNLHPAQDKI